MCARSISITMPIQKKKDSDRLDIINKNKEKKQEMFKRFQEKNKELSNLLKTEKSVEMPNNISKKNQDENFKRLLKSNKTLTKKNQELSNVILELKRKDRKNKDKIFNITNENSDLLEDIKGKEILIKNLKDDLSVLKREKEELIQKNEKLQQDFLVSENERLKNINAELKNKLIQSEHRNKNLTQKIQKYELLGSSDLNVELEKKYSNLKKSYANVVNKIRTSRDYKTVKSLKGIINSLNHSISNLKKVNTNLLKYVELNKIYIFLEYYLSINWQKNWIELTNTERETVENSQNIVKLDILSNIKEDIEDIKIFNDENVVEVDNFEVLEDNKNDVDDEYVYGYIVRFENEFKFISINGGIYNIINQQICKDDFPSKAKITEENNVEVLEIYSQTDNGINRIKKYKNKAKNNIKINKGTNILKDYYEEIFNGFAVLIVGSLYKYKYTSTLSSVGLNVLWFNPYEEHISNLKNKAKNVDVVILCAEHISHSVLDVLKSDNKKVHIIYNDTTNKILARIKFSLIVQGKI